jgi:hypothetical protein
MSSQLLNREERRRQLSAVLRPGEEPAGGTSYAFCVYDATPTGPVSTYQGQPGGQCDVEPCWSTSPMDWKFTSKSGVPDGITSVMLQEGLMPGMARVQVKAKGLLTLEGLPLQMSPNVIAQVRTGDGKCWGGDILDGDEERQRTVHREVGLKPSHDPQLLS